MKSNFVSELAADQTVTSFFLVCEKEIRTGQAGKPYLRLALGDRTGTVEARMWENFEKDAAGFSRDDFVKVQARVETYRGRHQLIIERVRRAESTEVEVVDYYPHTTQDIEALFTELREFCAGIGNPWLRRLVAGVIEDPEIQPRLKRAPAAKSMHHAYIGGLLEHVVSLCRLCRAVCAQYPEADADLVLTGAMLHDIGKIDELTYERSIGYSTAGQLLGHIVIELEMVTKKLDAIEDFPRELKIIVQHLLISHHGKYEFGSPKLPMLREAVLLHYCDDLDSKMAAVRATLSTCRTDDEWTDRNAALDRRLLRLERYLNGQPATPAGAEQLPLMLAGDAAKKEG